MKLNYENGILCWKSCLLSYIALCLMPFHAYYAQTYSGIVGTTNWAPTNESLSTTPPVNYYCESWYVQQAMYKVNYVAMYVQS